MMNSLPNFDRNNPRQYPTYENAPIFKGEDAPMPNSNDAKSNDSNWRRIVRCFNAKVILCAALAILVMVDFIHKPFVSSLNGDLLVDWLLFACGLIVALFEVILQQKRRATMRIPLWLRILLIIVFLVVGFFSFQFLIWNNFVYSLCQGAVAGIGIVLAVAAYRKAREASR